MKEGVSPAEGTGTGRQRAQVGGEWGRPDRSAGQPWCLPSSEKSFLEGDLKETNFSPP